jgi:hypothetical protein
MEDLTGLFLCIWNRGRVQVQFPKGVKVMRDKRSEHLLAIERR